MTDTPKTAEQIKAEADAAYAGRTFDQKAQVVGAEVRKDIKEAAGAVAGAAADGAKVAADAVTNPSATVDKAKEAGKGFFENLNVGSMTGSMLGLLGAWFISTIFAEGWLGTFLMLALAVPMMMMGSKFGNETINGWLGAKKPDDKSGPEVQHAQGKDGPTQQRSQTTDAPATAQAATPAPLKPGTLELSQQDYLALMDGAHKSGLKTDKVTIAQNGPQVYATVVSPEADAANAHNQITSKVMDEAFAICKAKTGEATIRYDAMPGGVPMPSCAPKAATVNSPAPTR